MSTEKKLRNIGKRTIEISGKEFRPNSSGRFSLTDAEKLLKLFPEEVQDLEAAMKDFNEDAPAKAKVAAAPAPVAEPVADEDKTDPDAHPTLEQAFTLLDPKNDSHWTRGGLADLNALREITGVAVTAKQRDAAGAGFNREIAGKTVR